MHQDLARVGVLKKGLLEGEPSNRALARAVGTSPTTIGEWLGGKALPRELGLLQEMLALVRTEAARRGLLDAPAEIGGGETVGALVDPGRWRASWEAEHDKRVQASQRAAEHGRSRKALENEEKRARRAALVDPPRLVRTWSAQRLGVHPAIPGHSSDNRDTGFVLPRYVARPHDGELREHLQSALAPEARPLLAVVRGRSCTGKTRTAYEALSAVVPDDFDLLFPADATGLLQAVAADALGPGTVLWLNEAHTYLDGAEGEAVAAALVRLLDGEGPLVVIATLWPDHDATFAAHPAPGQGDPHPRVRALLRQACYTQVPDTFTNGLEQARKARDLDPSLKVALDTGGDYLTQTLAAGPDLVDHYEHPTGKYGVYGRALISAAMDAYRLGATAPVTYDFLKAAASGYLTPAERAAAPQDWFAGALAYARTAVKHVAAPLADVPRPSGMGALPGVVALADYLRQHGRFSRRLVCPPASFWDAATTHLSSASELLPLAHAAQRRGRLLTAARLFCAAADANSSAALSYLAGLRENAGDHEGAARLWWVAEDADDPIAWERLARLRERAGDDVSAARLWQVAADAGSARALSRLVDVRVRLGDYAGAERAARAASQAGDPWSLQRLAVPWEERAGEDEEAERCGHLIQNTRQRTPRCRIEFTEWDWNGKDTPHRERALEPPGGSWQGAILEKQAGDAETVTQIFQDAMETLDYRPLSTLLVDLSRSTDPDMVELILYGAAETGNIATLKDMISHQQRAGHHETAERIALTAANAGTVHSLVHLARVRGNGNHGEDSTAEAQYLRYGLTAEGDLAEPWEWPEPRLLSQGGGGPR